jgi:hypothetical protein
MSASSFYGLIQGSIMGYCARSGDRQGITPLRVLDVPVRPMAGKPLQAGISSLFSDER